LSGGEVLIDPLVTTGEPLADDPLWLPLSFPEPPVASVPVLEPVPPVTSDVGALFEAPHPSERALAATQAAAATDRALRGPSVNTPVSTACQPSARRPPLASENILAAFHVLGQIRKAQRLPKDAECNA
jgi:hypothetical protein